MNQRVTQTPIVERAADSGPSQAELEAIDRALIDVSTRGPVLFFFTTALTWLLAATAFGLVASIKMHTPGFLGNWSWFTYGRVWPAFQNTLVYGWAMPVGIGTAIWLMARLCRVSLRNGFVPIIGGIFWNIGITIGIIAILSGNMRPFELLEFPRASALMLFIALSLVAIWGVVMFRKRHPGHTYISLWYLIGAFFWLPWLYGAANVMVG